MLALPPTYGAKTGEGSRTALSTYTQDAVKSLPLVNGAGGPPAEHSGLGLSIHRVPGVHQPGVSPLHAMLNRTRDTAFAFVFLFYRSRNRLQMADSPPQTLGAPLGRPLGGLQCPSPATLSKKLEWPFCLVWGLLLQYRSWVWTTCPSASLPQRAWTPGPSTPAHGVWSPGHLASVSGSGMPGLGTQHQHGTSPHPKHMLGEQNASEGRTS